MVNQYTNPWTKEEIKILKDNYELFKRDRSKPHNLFNKLNRSRNAITLKAIKLGLQDKQWTQKEINYLKSNYQLKPAWIIAKYLGRSIFSIQQKVTRMGLKKLSSKPNPQKLLLWKLGYLAGFIDGEGTLSIRKKKSFRYYKGKKYDSYTITYKPIFSMAVTHEKTIDELLVWLYSCDFISPKKYVKKKKGFKPLYIIEINRHDEIHSLLNALYPFFILKKKQAELLMKYCGDRLKNKYKPYTKQQISLYLQIKKLNKRGGSE